MINMLCSNPVIQNNHSETINPTPKRILVVDDDESIREVVAFCLQKFGGWEVLTAASGEDALYLASREVPDAIVLDMMMPKMDGLTFLEYLRSNPITVFIPVVLLTAKTHLPESYLFPKLGVIKTIYKPFFPLELVQEIDQALEW